jgi:hypothetical protein
MIEFPDEIDLEIYRKFANLPQQWNKEKLLFHYEEYGKNECKPTSIMQIGSRNFILNEQNKNPQHNFLEIGPGSRPVLRGNNVYYLDICNQDELNEKDRTTEYYLDYNDDEPTKSNVLIKSSHSAPTIHYDNLEKIDIKFLCVFSSHCIEHTTNIIKHINDVENILINGGFYHIIIPDCRFCFDHFVPQSTIIDVITAYIENHKIHTYKNLLITKNMLTHNEPSKHWNGIHGEPRYIEKNKLKIANLNFVTSKTDLHAWRFTPESFQHIYNLLLNDKFVNMKLIKIYPTIRNSNEFTVILQKM